MKRRHSPILWHPFARRVGRSAAYLHGVCGGLCTSHCALRTKCTKISGSELQAIGLTHLVRDDRLSGARIFSAAHHLWRHGSLCSPAAAAVILGRKALGILMGITLVYGRWVDIHP